MADVILARRSCKYPEKKFLFEVITKKRTYYMMVRLKRICDCLSPYKFRLSSLPVWNVLCFFSSVDFFACGLCFCTRFLISDRQRYFTLKPLKFVIYITRLK